MILLAYIQANLHGLWYLLRWPPQAHQVCSVYDYQEFDLHLQRIHCSDCDKVFYDVRWYG